MYASLVFQSDAVQGTEQTQGAVEVADILTDWSGLGLWLPHRLCWVERLGLAVGNEGQDIGGGDKGGHAEKAGELDLDETRHDQSRKVCHSGDRRDGEEDALAGLASSCYHTEEMRRDYFILLIALIVLDSELRDEFLLL